MRSAHAAPINLSLREVFVQAPTLWQIADPSPVVTISLYRLLLAILHRSLRGPRNAEEWARIRDRGARDTSAIDAYLTSWRSRFDLFDPRFPFYQTPGLLTDRADAATVLTHERASGRNGALLFDHTTSDIAGLRPDAAARALLAQHNFAVGGLIGYDSAREPIANKYVGAAPLLKSAVCLVHGANLFETLMLNWLHYSPNDSQPFPFRADDQPAWERETPTQPNERIPDGYVDLLTWQSRRILLLPALTPEGQTIVERAVLMKGYQFSPSFDRWTAETMLSFHKSPKASATGGDPWFPLALRADRVVWRDSQALLQSTAEDNARPRTLSWLYTLMIQGYLSERRVLPLDVFGMIPDQANIDDWRHESLPLPLALLNDNTMLEAIGQAVSLAESLGRLLAPYAMKLTFNGKPITISSPVSVLAEELLVGTSGRSADSKAREQLVNSFGASHRFWAQLDTPFRQFLVALPNDIATDAYGQRIVGQVALAAWTAQVARIVRDVFQRITANQETSARALRAVALAQSRFQYCLSALLPSTRQTATPATAPMNPAYATSPTNITPGETTR